MLKLLATTAAVCMCAFAFSQSLSGTVKDDEGNALPGAHVRVGETFIATYTNENGEFSIPRMAKGTFDIIVTYIGFEKYTLPVVVGGADVKLNVKMMPAAVLAPEFSVRAIRANNATPTAYTNMTEEEIDRQNLGQDMPYMMEMQPSVVVTSDAGAGVGYTGMRVRGVDPTRVNVTINGIPLNDAESQGVFWVNMPDFASSTESIQIQRGVGTSTNGAGAFGATVNLQTTGLREEQYLEVSNTVGSFNTLRNNVTFGTGLLGGAWSLDGRLSRISSDGYIDRASAELNSYFMSAGHQTARSSTKLNVFSGHEVTNHAWYGTPSAKLNNDAAGIEDYIINNGLTAEQADNLRNSDRKYNHYLYDNEVDDYRQTHYQLINELKLNSKNNLQTALHYTRGAGFFEQYRDSDDLADYGLNDVTIGTTTISQSDIIRRRWLDNHFYGATFSLHSTLNSKGSSILGGAWNRYLGGHFGEVIWAEYASNGDIRHEYYNNDATKGDLSFYYKLNYYLAEKLNVFSDIQFRFVNYDFVGFDQTGASVDQSIGLTMFNPKVGLTYELTTQSALFASAAVGTKEPNRDDYTESSPNSRPLPEQLVDYELGYRVNGEKAMLSANGYFMNYQNQLVLTGQINDVGAATRVNIDRSYRAGIELVWGMNITDRIEWQANATLSNNRIQEFTGFVDNWDTWGQDSTVYENTPIAFSPGMIAGSNLIFKLIRRDTTGGKGAADLDLSFLSKYVGKQYIDNTGSEDRVIDPYFLNDVRVQFGFDTKFLSRVELNFIVRNLFNVEYSSNAWVYRFTSGGMNNNLDGYFPQAGTHYLLGLTLKF